jgi:hypothetical protein
MLELSLARTVELRNVYNRLESGDAKFRIGLTILRLDRAPRLRPSTIW